MSHGLIRKGFRVRAFDDPAEFQKISGDLAPGCAVLVVRGEIAETPRTAVVLKASRRLPWIAIGDLQSRLNDVVQLMKLGELRAFRLPGARRLAA